MGSIGSDLTKTQQEVTRRLKDISKYLTEELNKTGAKSKALDPQMTFDSIPMDEKKKMCKDLLVDDMQSTIHELMKRTKEKSGTTNTTRKSNKVNKKNKTKRRVHFQEPNESPNNDPENDENKSSPVVNKSNKNSNSKNKEDEHYVQTSKGLRKKPDSLILWEDKIKELEEEERIKEIAREKRRKPCKPGTVRTWHYKRCRTIKNAEKSTTMKKNPSPQKSKTPTHSPKSKSPEATTSPNQVVAPVSSNSVNRTSNDNTTIPETPKPKRNIDTTKPCGPGKARPPGGKYCRKIENLNRDYDQPRPCKNGKVKHPETGKCRKPENLHKNYTKKKSGKSQATKKSTSPRKTQKKVKEPKGLKTHSNSPLVKDYIDQMKTSNPKFEELYDSIHNLISLENNAESIETIKKVIPGADDLSITALTSIKKEIRGNLNIRKKVAQLKRRLGRFNNFADDVVDKIYEEIDEAERNVSLYKKKGDKEKMEEAMKFLEQLKDEKMENILMDMDNLIEQFIEEHYEDVMGAYNKLISSMKDKVEYIKAKNLDLGKRIKSKTLSKEERNKRRQERRRKLQKMNTITEETPANLLGEIEELDDAAIEQPKDPIKELFEDNSPNGDDDLGPPLTKEQMDALFENSPEN